MNREPRHQRRPPRRLIASSVALVAVLAPAVAGAGITIRNLDTSGVPAIRVTVVTQTPVLHAPHVLENGAPVAGLTAINLGSDKNIVLAVDHSQSMYGRSLTDAATAARHFIALGHRRDHFAVVTFASQTTVLAGFGSGGAAAGALDGLAVDPHYGTTLYDAVVRASHLLAAAGTAGRVLVLVTDGQETTSHATLDGAIRAARRAHVSVYPVAIESTSFSPAPLKLLASRTGGTYHGARSSAALTSIYATISAELQRTWQLQYVTAARPGDHIDIKVTAPGHGTAGATATVAGKVAASQRPSQTWLLIGLAVLMLAIAAFLLKPALSAAADRIRLTDPDS
jgi:von Willebrand factor type A domain-containing protein